MTIYKSKALLPGRISLLGPPPSSLVCPLLLPHHKQLAGPSHHFFNPLGGCAGTRICPRHLLAPRSVPGLVGPGETRPTPREMETQQSQAERWVTARPQLRFVPQMCFLQPAWSFQTFLMSCQLLDKLESSTLKFICQASAFRAVSQNKESLPLKKGKHQISPQIVIFLGTIRELRLPRIQVA